MNNYTVPVGRSGLTAGAVAAGLLCVADANAALPVADNGGEYPIAGSLVGDQVLPSMAFDAGGGVVAWQDNRFATGAGIFARKINGNLLGVFPDFQVNTSTNGIHEYPTTVRLQNGGAAIIWMGGPQGSQNVLARFLKPGAGLPSWVGPEFQVNSDTAGLSHPPKATALSDGSVIVAWTSPTADLDGDGILAQRLSQTGQPLGAAYLVNQSTISNQRNASVAALPNNQFVAVWISENQRFQRSADVFGRVFKADGTPVSDEIRLNSGTNFCGAAVVAPLSTGGFAAAWPEYNLGNPTAGWDVHARVFSANGVAATDSVVMNTTVPGNQIDPQIAVAGDYAVVTWTAFNQGVPTPQIFARALGLDGTPADVETPLNQLGLFRERDLQITADSSTGVIATVWSTFNSVNAGWDLASRRFTAQVVPTAVIANFQRVGTGFQISWPTVANGQYQLQSSLNLSDWTDVSTARTGSGGVDSVNLTAQTSAAFYRVTRTR
jgi:hypothetical protein